MQRSTDAGGICGGRREGGGGGAGRGGGGTRGARVSESVLITWGCDEIHPIGARRSVIVGLLGLKWA